MTIHKDTLILRIELITLGPDQILLGLAIAWLSRFEVKIPTEILFVGTDDEKLEVEVLKFEGLKLFLKNGACILESGIIEALKLPVVVHLLRDSLKDLTIAEGGPARMEFFSACDELKKLALRLRDENEGDSKFDPNEFEEFRQVSSNFQKKYLAEVDLRLRPLFFENKR